MDLHRLSPSEVRLITYFRRLPPDDQLTLERIAEITSKIPLLPDNVIPFKATA